MPTAIASAFQPRKTPVQARSTTTVESICEAAIQVLIRDGADKFTTTRVADRAGVSVGTLYQYFPNKQSLLRDLLAQHLSRVTLAVEEICAASHGLPLTDMTRALIHTFVEAKMHRRDASVAFYALSSQLDAEPLSAEFRRRSHTAIVTMLRTASDARIHELDFTVTVLVSAMAGALRFALETGATRKVIDDLRRHLVLLAEAYLIRVSA